MDAVKVEYRLHFADGAQLCHAVKVSPHLEIPVEAEAPDWTRLTFHQCPGCRLSPDRHAQCPAALALAPLVTKLQGRVSHEPVRLEADSGGRRVSADTSLQRAAGSLFGLVLASSGCPQTRFLLPMARFHLPLADELETFYRVAGMYLLGRYCQDSTPEAAVDLQGLREKYLKLQSMNRALARRLRQACGADAPVNAVVVLDMLARAVPEDLDESLDSLRAWFALDESGDEEGPCRG